MGAKAAAVGIIVCILIVAITFVAALHSTKRNLEQLASVPPLSWDTVRLAWLYVMEVIFLVWFALVAILIVLVAVQLRCDSRD